MAAAQIVPQEPWHKYVSAERAPSDKQCLKIALLLLCIKKHDPVRKQIPTQNLRLCIPHALLAGLSQAQLGNHILLVNHGTSFLALFRFEKSFSAHFIRAILPQFSAL